MFNKQHFLYFILSGALSYDMHNSDNSQIYEIYKSAFKAAISCGVKKITEGDSVLIIMYDEMFRIKASDLSESLEDAAAFPDAATSPEKAPINNESSEVHSSEDNIDNEINTFARHFLRENAQGSTQKPEPAPEKKLQVPFGHSNEESNEDVDADSDNTQTFRERRRLSNCSFVSDSLDKTSDASRDAKAENDNAVDSFQSKPVKISPFSSDNSSETKKNTDEKDTSVPSEKETKKTGSIMNFFRNRSSEKQHHTNEGNVLGKGMEKLSQSIKKDSEEKSFTKESEAEIETDKETPLKDSTSDNTSSVKQEDKNPNDISDKNESNTNDAESKETEEESKDAAFSGEDLSDEKKKSEITTKEKAPESKPATHKPLAPAPVLIESPKCALFYRDVYNVFIKAYQIDTNTNERTQREDTNPISFTVSVYPITIKDETIHAPILAVFEDEKTHKVFLPENDKGRSLVCNFNNMDFIVRGVFESPCVFSSSIKPHNDISDSELYDISITKTSSSCRPTDPHDVGHPVVKIGDAFKLHYFPKKGSGDTNNEGIPFILITEHDHQYAYSETIEKNFLIKQLNAEFYQIYFAQKDNVFYGQTSNVTNRIKNREELHNKAPQSKQS